MSYGALNLLNSSSWKNDLLNSTALTAGKKFSITPTVTGNRRQFTIMANIRRTSLNGVTHQIVGAGEFYWGFTADNSMIMYSGASGGHYKSTRKFRDVEHMTVALMYDTVARTVRMSANGEEIDQWETQVFPTINYEAPISTVGIATHIGGDGAVAEFNVSDFVILDGEVLTPAEVDDYRTQNVPFGKNVITTTKKFTTEGKAARLHTLSRTNSALTVPIVQDESQWVERSGAAWGILKTEVLPNIKFQVELYDLTDTQHLILGVNKASLSTFDGNSMGVNGNHTAIYLNDSVYRDYDNGTTASADSGLGAVTLDDVVSCYFDIPNRRAYFSVNGTFIAGHDPVAGTGGNVITTDDLRMYLDLNGFTGARINFGQQDYAYPVDGYGPLQDGATSDLKRCKIEVSGGNSIMLKDRGLTAFNSEANWQNGYSNFYLKGKMYVEVTLNQANDQMHGVDTVKRGNGVTPNDDAKHVEGARHMYSASVDYLYVHPTGGSAGDRTNEGASVIGMVHAMAVDMDTREIWFRRDGVWLLGGDPALGTGGSSLVADVDYIFSALAYNTLGNTWNFGDSPWNDTPPTGFVGPASLDFDTLRPSGDDTQREYGPNGTQLLFEDPDLGKSTAGNLLPWTLTGITSSDQTDDTPGDPICVLNILDTYLESSSIINGALEISMNAATDKAAVRGTIAASSGKFYHEFKMGTVQAGFANLHLGWRPDDVPVDDLTTGVDAYNKGFSGLLIAGDVVGIAIDLDVGAEWFSLNGTWYDGATLAEIEAGTTTNAEYTGITGSVKPFFWELANSTGGGGTFNFGQQPFVHTVPTGFKILRSSNKETPKYHPRDKMDILNYVGTGVAKRYYSSTTFNNMLVMGKGISGGYNFKLYSTLSEMGATKELRPNDLANMAPDVNSLTAFHTDGYTAGIGSSMNGSGITYNAWLFGLDGTEITNSEGTIDTKIIADSSDYMSLFSWEGDAVSGATVATGITDAELVITKSMDSSTYSWHMWHKGLTDDYYQAFDNNSAQDNSVNIFPSAGRTSRLIQLTTNAIKYNNLLNQTYFGWAMKSVPGLLSIQVMTGNGSADGWFMQTDFLTRMVWIFRIDAAGAKNLLDTEMDSNGNPIREELNIDTLAAVTTAGGDRLDIDANGIKCRSSGAAFNADGGKYLVVAFADVAGGGNLPAVLGN